MGVCKTVQMARFGFFRVFYGHFRIFALLLIKKKLNLSFTLSHEFDHVVKHAVKHGEFAPAIQPDVAIPDVAVMQFVQSPTVQGVHDDESMLSSSIAVPDSVAVHVSALVYNVMFPSACTQFHSAL